MGRISDYLQTLVVSFGRGWNRFWFAPSESSTLAAIRIGAGLVALYLIASFTPNLETYFGAQGLLPLETLREFEPPEPGQLQNFPAQIRESLPRPHRFSYLDWLHSAGELWAAHLIGLVVLALFTAGLFTRLTSVLALIVVLSYNHRAPMLTGHAEPVLAFVLLYLCLGPAGRCWSLDRWLRDRRTDRPAPTPSGGHNVSAEQADLSWTATLSLRLIQIHLTLLYAMMALGKLSSTVLSSSVWWNGSAIWLLIGRTESRLVDLSWLHAHPYVISACCYAVLLWQTAFPILVWNRLARPLMLVVNAVMWLLLAPITGHVAGAVMMIVASLAFVQRPRHE
jgi:hypothetical protein